MSDHVDLGASGATAGAPALVPDRRQGQRYKSVLRIAKLICPRGEQLCVIRNISSGGLMAHVYARFEVGTQVRVEFKSGETLACTVRWMRQELAGMQFDVPIDVDAFLAGVDRQTAAREPRAPRLGVDTLGLMRCGVRYRPVTLCDISQGGAKLLAPDWTEVGQEVVMRVSGLPLLTGVIRWQNEQHAGIAFKTPIPLPVLAEWIAHVDPAH